MVEDDCRAIEPLRGHLPVEGVVGGQDGASQEVQMFLWDQA
jgi:hypothetical protein